MRIREEIKEEGVKEYLNKLGVVGKSLVPYIILGMGVTLLSSDILAFDLDKGMKAASEPLIKFANDHWGKVTAMSGVGTALVSEGDMRTRGVRALMGCAAAGASVLIILNALT